MGWVAIVASHAQPCEAWSLRRLRRFDFTLRPTRLLRCGELESSHWQQHVRVPVAYAYAYTGWTRRLIFFQLIFLQSNLFQSILVRRSERISMNREISSNPREAVRMDWARLGSRAKRP